MVNPDRLLPSRQLIRQQLDAGKLGDVGLLRIQRWETRPSQSTPHGLPPSLWRDLDLALWLIGQSPTHVFALKTPDEASAESSGCSVQVHLGFSGGAMALIGYSNQLPTGDGYQALTVIGSAGAAYADDHQNRQLVFRGGSAQAVRATECDERHSTKVREFDNGLSMNSSPAELADVQRVNLVAEAVQRSLDSRQAVVLAQEVA